MRDGAENQGPEQAGAARETHPIRRILLTLAGCLIGLLILEVPAATKLIDYRETGWLSLNRYDPELLFIRRPYARSVGSSKGGVFASLYKIPPADFGSYHWDVRYDHNGFRNPADLTRADIAVIGSSYVLGETVPDAQLMTTLLGQRENAVVANLGEDAYAPQQELIVLKRYALPLKPRTVIWMFTDFADVKQELIFADQTKYQSGLGAMLQRSFTWNATLKVANTVKNAALDIENVFVPDRARDAANRAGVIHSNSGDVKMYFLHPGLALDATQIAALNRSIEVLKTANQLCASQGARLAVVFIPDQFRVFHSFVATPSDSELRKWVVNDTPNLLEQGLKADSPPIEFLDLTPAMQDAVKKGVVPYFTDDNHWNPAGQRIAARAIAGSLETSGQ